MRNGYCISGLGRLAVLITALFMFFALAACGTSEDECGEGETFAADRDGSNACLTQCDNVGSSEECEGDRVCDSRNLCSLPPSGDGDGDGDADADGGDADADGGDADADADGGDTDGDGDGGEGCNLVAACESLCTAENGRCLEENCGSIQFEGDEVPMSDLVDLEVDACVNGFQGEGLSVAGCLDRGQAQCESIEEEAVLVEAESCDSPYFQNFVCSNLNLYFYTIGEDVYNSCGCEDPNIATACEEDADCGDLDRNLCFEGECTAFCNGWGGAFEGSLIPDPTCGVEGVCSDYQYVAEIDDFIGVCFKGCKASADCPEATQGCLLAGSGPGGNLGVCAEAACTVDDTSTCPEEGQGCFEGNCVDTCEADADCNNGPCGENGFCEIEFTLFSEMSAE